MGWKEIISADLDQEARELKALAAMLRDGEINNHKDFRENYLPLRIARLRHLGSRQFVGAFTTQHKKSRDCEEAT